MAIEGVIVKPLTWHNDQRGSLAELVRADDPALMHQPFGQVYVTTLYPGVVKAWHKHERQWDRMICLRGRVMLGLVDDRPDSPTRGQSMSIVLGDRNFCVVMFPPLLWHGLKNISAEEAMVCNVVSQPYDRVTPDEIRCDAHGVLDFDWSRHDR
ncbi:MAG: dTDP-4-dehydrorhamnose 3,5-epimerase family protein [Alphaproteobacteria bacterium]|nr:dTDP-4-dehydrorhamnose 3,5-epimerase family protein [Alphaproteobacteria bacterium]MCB9792910.1 dTDP-4-dehydrorhamnose 3,5-epimerase family protein [Alphaproteobacteria bacterium]